MACEEAKNEVSVNTPSRKIVDLKLIILQRLSTKSNLKLAKLWLDRKEYKRLEPVC